jgi:ribosomal protein L32
MVVLAARPRRIARRSERSSILGDPSEGVKHGPSTAGGRAAMAHRSCPQCGEEYVSTAMECADCRVPLVGGSAPVAPRAQELPPAAQLVCVRQASLSFARGLSERLADAGISHRIEVLPEDDTGDGRLRRPDSMNYGVYVRHEDAAAASRLDEAHLRSEFPDLPQDAVPGDGCPACGAATAPDARECPDCGLSLAADA